MTCSSRFQLNLHFYPGYPNHWSFSCHEKIGPEKIGHDEDSTVAKRDSQLIYVP